MRRNRRRRRRASGPLGLAPRATGSLLGLAALVAGGSWLAHRVLDHPYFRLRDVEVAGARNPERVVAWAGVHRDASVLRLDPTGIERRLEHHPRVRRATVVRELPGRLRIMVEERRPLAVVLLETPLFLDAEGRLFPPHEDEMLDDRPYVTGLRADDLSRRPAWTTARLREAARVLRMWGRYSAWYDVSEVRAEESGEIVVFPRDAKMTIRFGSEVSEEQFSRLVAVLELWRGRETHIAAIDLTVPGQAILRLREGEAPAAERLRI